MTKLLGAENPLAKAIKEFEAGVNNAIKTETTMPLERLERYEDDIEKAADLCSRILNSKMALQFDAARTPQAEGFQRVMEKRRLSEDLQIARGQITGYKDVLLMLEAGVEPMEEDELDAAEERLLGRQYGGSKPTQNEKSQRLFDHGVIEGQRSAIEAYYGPLEPEPQIVAAQQTAEILAFPGRDR